MRQALETLELIDCTFADTAPKEWAVALADNKHTRLAALTLRSGLTKSKADVAAALAAMISSWKGERRALELSSCGASAKGATTVCDALNHHSTRLATLGPLQVHCSPPHPSAP